MLKIEVARRQLGTALALYLDDLDPVSVHCLANGGGEIAEFYAEKASGNPFISHIAEHRPDLSTKAIRDIRRQHWNAFKHAAALGRGSKERDDRELLQHFDDYQNDDALFIGWIDYSRATGQMPLEAQVHQAWYLAAYPERVAPDADIEASRELFGRDLPSCTRTEQKHRLRTVVERYRSASDVMLSPLTDSRPLILPWKWQTGEQS